MEQDGFAVGGPFVCAIRDPIAIQQSVPCRETDTKAAFRGEVLPCSHRPIGWVPFLMGWRIKKRPGVPNDIRGRRRPEEDRWVFVRASLACAELLFPLRHQQSSGSGTQAGWAGRWQLRCGDGWREVLLPGSISP